MSESLKPVKTIVVEGPSKALFDRLQATKFRVLTAVYFVDKPKLHMYEMDAEAMKKWFDGYDQHGEYVLAIEPLDKSVLDFIK